jgi:hypothetical protein
MIDTINSYKNSLMQYNFPTLNEFKKLLPTHMKIENINYASHELSERCPILTINYNPIA